MQFGTYVFAVAAAACAVGITVRGFAPRPVSELKGLREKNGVFHTPAPMERKDLLPLALIMLIYSAAAFFGLGSHTAPQTFYKFSDPEASLVLSLTETVDSGDILWYSGIKQGKYLVEVSGNAVTWNEQGVWEQGSGEQLKWHSEPLLADNVSFIRITETSGSSYLGEVILRSSDGRIIPFSNTCELTDEPETVPESPSYLNSTYFDEVYHVRTAYEYIIGESIYENSHPPLGKGIISLGIRIFGLNPFGWRFSGVFFGILMLPILYIFLKNLFGRTAVAVCGTLIFAFDFMHYVQTRIATIDTYGTFFILLMFYFMYRWLTLPADARLKRSLPLLFAAGLFFGIGISCKWTVVYGGAGLALVWLLRMIIILRYRGKDAIGEVFAVIGASIIFFIVIPAFIYCASYQPYGAAEKVGFFSAEYFGIVLKNQQFMFSYHSGLEATHPYQSEWWKWVLDIRPILYYLEYFDSDSTKSAFGAFGNPLFWWAGLGCLVSLAATTVRRRDAVGFLILAGWLSEILPWVIITRCAFIYHYFPCTVFLALAVAYQLEGLCRSKEAAAAARISERSHKRFRRSPRCCDGAIFVFTALCIAMFLIFFPVLTGIRFDRSYTTGLLRWFGGEYPF